MCLYLQIQAFRRAKDRRNRPSRFRAFEGSLGCWYPISLICPIYVVVNCRSSRKDITYSRYGIEKIYCWALWGPDLPLQSTNVGFSILLQLVSTFNRHRDCSTSENFVHEGLKCSRTSGSIMQTALCYLKVVHSKVPDILRDEKLGVRAYFMPESAILPATEAELQMDQKLLNLEGSVRWRAWVLYLLPSVSSPHVSSCPRRLVLASKISQDKCYSNHAWAKLSELKLDMWMRIGTSPWFVISCMQFLLQK